MTGTLQLGSTRLERRADEWFVVCPAELLGETTEWWISVETAFVGALDVSPAPFLSVATLLAARHGQDIEIVEPVAEVHVANCRAAAAILHEWWGWRIPQIRSVPTTADQAATESVFDESRPDDSLTGLLFTRGVDSTSVLLQGLEGDGPRADLLIFVDGIEPVYSPLTSAQNWRDIVAVADTLGLPVARLHTNLRTVAERWIRWEDAHGAVLIGTALALGRSLTSLLIAPTSPATGTAAFGSHPELDPLWSTAHTTVVAADPRGSRVDRLRRIVRRPEMLRTLKFCWASDQRGNCGRCRKCLMTASAFVAIGETTLIPVVFDAPLSVAAIRALPSNPSTLMAEVLAALRTSTPAPAERAFVDLLCDAWQDVMDRCAAAGNANLTDAPSHGAIAIDAHALCLTDVDHVRANRWCLIDTYSEGHCRLAWKLSTNWGPGLVSLAVGEPLAPPPAVAQRMMQTAIARCWWSDGDRLDLDRALAALQAGCVPFQVMSPDRAHVVRCGLPASARGLVLGLDQIESGWPTDADLESHWYAAVRIALHQAAVSMDQLVPA
jgi:hypothetical protein